MIKNQHHAAYEREYMPTLRMIAEGSRQVVCAHFDEIALFMLATGAVALGGSISPARAKGFFKSMTKDAFESYTRSGHSLYTATMGSGEAMYMPAAMVFAERSQGTRSLVGFRWVASAIGSRAALRFRNAFAASLLAAKRSLLSMRRAM